MYLNCIFPEDASATFLTACQPHCGRAPPIPQHNTRTPQTRYRHLHRNAINGRGGLESTIFPGRLKGRDYDPHALGCATVSAGDEFTGKPSIDAPRRPAASRTGSRRTRCTRSGTGLPRLRGAASPSDRPDSTERCRNATAPNGGRPVPGSASCGAQATAKPGTVVPGAPVAHGAEPPRPAVAIAACRLGCGPATAYNVDLEGRACRSSPEIGARRAVCHLHDSL